MFSVFANDINLVGTKTITVTGYFVLHSSNTFTITFELDMITPCGQPDILEIIVPEDLPVTVPYFLTDTDQYQLPEFEVNFAVCDLTYDFEVDQVDGYDGISFNEDVNERRFTYSFALSAAYLKTYEIKAIVSVSESPSVYQEVQWDLVAYYPCSYPDIITISGEPPETVVYALFTESLEAPFTFNHDAFTIALQGSDEDNTLCGGLTYQA